jgi:hypothetical protein
VAWWISGAIVLLALVGLVVAAVVVLASLRRFGMVAQSLQRRLLDGQRKLQPSLDTLQERAEGLQGPLLAAQERAEALQGGTTALRGGPPRHTP